MSDEKFCGPAPAYGGPPPYDSYREPQTEFDVFLIEPDTSIIRSRRNSTSLLPPLKLVRELLDCGLADAKRMVDAAWRGEPQLLKRNVGRAEAEDIQRKFSACGARVRLT